MNSMENQELIYMESKTLRDETINNVEYDFLDKIKVIPYLTTDMVVTLDQIATYYEVPVKTIQTLVSRNRDEFENDGMIVLKGTDLKAFLDDICYPQLEGDKSFSKIRSLTLLNKSSLLRCGMLLTGSGIAKSVRQYLINLEKGSAIDRKSWIIQREVARIERKRMTTAISKYIPDSAHKKFAYPNYTNMIYDIVFGKTAKELKEERNADDDSLRDKFSEEELKIIEEMESIVVGLLAMDFTYKQIKDALVNRFQKKLEEKK